MIRNVHIYPSSFRFESRILKETESIIKHGLATEIEIVAIWESGLPEREKIDSQRSVWRVKTNYASKPKSLWNEFLKFFSFIYQTVRAYRKSKPAYINCHSLSVLPVGVLLKLSNRKACLIYDTHELETLRNGLHGVRKWVTKCLEYVCMPFVNSIIVVSPSIGKWYSTKYNKPVFLLRNIPKKQVLPKRSTVFRELFTIPDNHILFIYQGLLGKGRGIEKLLQVFSSLPENKHIVFMGYGQLENEVQQLAKLHSNIHFHPAVPQHEIIAYTSGADVGICLIENTCLSYFYSLPNKLFEYILCGIPVIASHFPDMREVVEEHHAGWTCETDEESIARIIKDIKQEDINKVRNEMDREKLSWENEENQLIMAFKCISK